MQFADILIDYNDKCVPLDALFIERIAIYYRDSRERGWAKRTFHSGEPIIVNNLLYFSFFFFPFSLNVFKSLPVYLYAEYDRIDIATKSDRQ